VATEHLANAACPMPTVMLPVTISTALRRANMAAHSNRVTASICTSHLDSSAPGPISWAVQPLVKSTRAATTNPQPATSPGMNHPYQQSCPMACRTLKGQHSSRWRVPLLSARGTATQPQPRALAFPHRLQPMLPRFPVNMQAHVCFEHVGNPGTIHQCH
jgi:hypothetical protein